jgi:hypothetical protein
LRWQRRLLRLRKQKQLSWLRLLRCPMQKFDCWPQQQQMQQRRF